jgi:hypothetical protein
VSFHSCNLWNLKTHVANRLPVVASRRCFGLIGEYAKSDRWKKHVKLFELLVIIGVAGELIADGGIFLFSSHLQTIAEAEIGEVTKQAGDAKLSANEAKASAVAAREIVRVLTNQVEALGPRSLNLQQQQAVADPPEMKVPPRSIVSL